MSKKVCTKCGKPNKNKGSTWCNACIAKRNKELANVRASRGIIRKVIDVSDTALKRMGKGSKGMIEALVEDAYGEKE